MIRYYQSLSLLLIYLPLVIRSLHSDSPSRIKRTWEIWVVPHSLSKCPYIQTSFSRQLTGNSLVKWPSQFLVPQFPNLRIRVTGVQLLDSFQAVDMKLALHNLIAIACTNQAGQRTAYSSSKIAHTLTGALSFCEPRAGLGLQAQKAQLAAAIQVIWEGQTTYTPAAIHADVVSSEGVPPGQPPRYIGSIFAKIEAIPPTPEHKWERNSLSLQVYRSPGHRIHIRTDPILSPTLDTWNTQWFRSLLNECIGSLEISGTPQMPMRSFWGVLPPKYMNDIVFSFRASIVPGAEVPTFELLSNILRTLDYIFAYQGARPLKFNLLNDNDGHIGFGYMEFIQPKASGMGLTLVNASASSPAISSSWDFREHVLAVSMSTSTYCPSHHL